MALMAADALAPRDACRGCLSSDRAAVQWRDLQPSVDRFRVETEVDAETLVVRVVLETDSGRVALARVRCDFGDGVESAWTAVLDRRAASPLCAAGRSEVVTWSNRGTGGHRSDRRAIDVPAAAGGRAAF